MAGCNLKKIIRPLIPEVLINIRNEQINTKEIITAAEKKTAPFSKDAFPYGIRLFGDGNSGTGIGEEVNRMREVAERSGIPYSYIRIPEDGRGEFPANEAVFENEYGINIFVVQPNIWPRVRKALPDSVFDNHYNIAYWAWETPVIPKEWVPLCGWFDEIWGISDFVADAIRKVSDRPVREMRLCFDVSDMKMDNCKDAAVSFRSDHGIPEDSIVYLTMFDGRSCMERKNPAGAIEAFKKAFPEEKDDVFLIVKGKETYKGKKKKLRESLSKYRNVIWIDERLSREKLDGMMAASDVLISLHRAEGFGLPVAEMMLLGKAVVSTAYSATVEFTDESCAVMVPCEQVTLKHDVIVYRKGTVWAEPDIDAAAKGIRRLYDDPEYRKRISEAAVAKVRETLSLDIAAEKMKRYIDEIYG
jgi:glycosyltransferase involved in cell wall biosynthesis